MRQRLINLALCLLAAIIMPTAASAQIKPLPVDSAVRVGTLPNGLTYYIRHNEYPKGQADFFIAQKVGSVLEEDNQRGLAHFLEHMCFNGTTNFPGHQVRNWLADKGVQFGRDLNAYTSYDETVYNISSVPVTNTNVEDSCLLILHDWASDLLLNTDDINEERGVIEQEWRRTYVGQSRILEQALTKFFPDSRYGYRRPIGTMDVVLNFDPEALRSYYRKWYRPDLQAIIVVGDIDPDRIEGKIKEIFSPIKMPADAAKREYFEVADHKGTITAIGSDPEMNVGRVDMVFGNDIFPREMRNSMDYLVVQYMNQMITDMLNQRLEDIASKPDSPFAYAGCDVGEIFGFVKTRNSFMLVSIAKDGDVKPSMTAAYRELQRALRGGFTQSELDRAKAEFISGLEKAYNDRNARKSTEFAREYVGAFIDNDPIPGIGEELKLARLYTQAIPVEAINAYFQQLVTPDNRYIMVSLPQREGVTLPTEEELSALIAGVDAEEIEAYREELRPDPLIAKEPVAGKIVSTRELPQWGAEEWTLSNGAKVVVKQTKFKEDEILFAASAKGGISTFSDINPGSVTALPYLLETLSGGTYTVSDLKKYTAGKKISTSFEYDDYTRFISGTTTVKDLPTLLEVFYAQFATPNIDAAEFEATVNQLNTLFGNMESDPQMMFSKYMFQSLYESPRKQVITPEGIKQASRDEVLSLISAMNANAADYLFCFVGNVDTATLRPLVEKYIASLPADASSVTETVTYLPELGIKPGKERNTFTMPMQTPQVYAVVYSSGNAPYSLKNVILSRLAQNILDNRLTNEIREEMQAVYSIHAQSVLRRLEQPNQSFLSGSPMKPELAEKAIARIGELFESITQEIKPEELAKAKEVTIKDYKANLEQNRPWLYSITGSYLNGVDNLNGAIEATEAVTADEVKKYVKDLLDQGNIRTIVLNPEAPKAD